jgi:hypothetical protein
MAGLGAALACARARPEMAIDLFERAPEFSEVGAGIQLSPNAVRVLHDWGLQQPLEAVAAFPSELRVRAADDGRVLGRLALGEAMRQRYGAPYATIHRADLHRLLLQALLETTTVALHKGQVVIGHQTDADGVAITTASGARWHADALLAADGVWSAIRTRLLGDGRAAFSGHLAYRGMVRREDLPAALRTSPVVAWLGARMHAVHYPVRAGAWFNVVVVVEGGGPLPPGRCRELGPRSARGRSAPALRCRAWGSGRRATGGTRLAAVAAARAHAHAGATRARPGTGGAAGRCRAPDTALSGPGRGDGAGRRLGARSAVGGAAPFRGRGLARGAGALGAGALGAQRPRTSPLAAQRLHLPCARTLALGTRYRHGAAGATGARPAVVV